MTARRVALITGCGERNLGSAIAREAAARDYAVMLGYFNAQSAMETLAAELEAAGSAVAACRTDVANEAEVEELIAQTVNEFGRIDLVAACASLWAPKDFEEVSAKDLLDHYAVNTAGTYLCAQKAGLVMAGQQEGGSIVTFGDWAIDRPYIGYSAYSIAKGAVPTLTAVLANELAKLNPKIRVNCIHPGILTAPHPPTGELLDKVVNRTPAKRLGEQKNVVDAVFFLAENEYMTGSCLRVDGGRTISPT